MKTNKTSTYIASFAALTLLLSGCNETTRSSQRSPATQTGHSTTTQAVQTQTTAQTASQTAAVSTPQTTPQPVSTRPIPAMTTQSSYAPYQVRVPLSGYVRSIGSDTMDQMIADWETELGRFHPGLRFRHEGKGSSTAIPALLEQRADIGPMSRELKSAEIARFVEKFGYQPTQLPVAIDTLAVYVHPNNPILKAGLSLDQVARIFSESDTPIERWGQLGLEGEWTNAPIRLYGRNPASGTHAFFKSHVLNKQSFSKRLSEQAGSAEVVSKVGNDPYAIGYSGIAYSTPQVASVPLKASNGKYVNANKANAVSGLYPLTRKLYVTLNIDPSLGASDMQKEFLRFAFSREGQKIVEQVGYFPIATQEAQKALKSIK